MSLMTRHVAGESLAPHVASRLDGCGVASGGGLLSRLGMGNPWTGDSTVDPRVAARAAREARLQARLSRFDRAPIRASRRMWPGERRRGFAFGLRGLSVDDMVFPLMPEEEVEEEEVQEGRPRRRRNKTGPMRPVAKPWHSVEHAPARVIRGGRRAPAARTARVSRSGRERFEPAPRARRAAPAVDAVVTTAPSSPDARARDLVAASEPVRRRAVRSPAPVQRSAAFRTVRAEQTPRVRAMDRTGARISALLGRVQVANERPERQPAVASTRQSVTALRETIPASVAARTAGTTGSQATISRTASTSSAGARTSRTPAGSTTAARSVRTASTATQDAQTRSTSVVARRERDSVARAARPARDQDLADSEVRPLAVATGRVGAAGRKERRRGLRPVFRHSPVMAVVEPDLAELADDEAAELETPRRAASASPRAEVRRVKGFAAGTPRTTAVNRAATASRQAKPSASMPRTPARRAGTGWVARRMEVGTAETGSFLPRVMTRPQSVQATAPQATRAVAGTDALSTATSAALAATAPAQAITADAAVPTGPASSVTAPVDKLAGSFSRATVARRNHVAGVLKRFESGTVAPGSTLPVAVPRRVRTGQARSLWLSSPEAIMPEAPATPDVEQDATPATAPRSRATQSPRVIRSSDRASAPPASTTRVATAAATAGSSRRPAGASPASRSSAGMPAVMDFGSVSRAAKSTGTSGALAAPTPKVARAQATTEAVPASASQPRAMERVAAREAGLPSSSKGTMAARAAGVRPQAAYRGRAVEVAAARTEPLQRSRSLLPRRPRPTAVRHSGSEGLAPLMADGRPSVAPGTAASAGSTQGYSSTLAASTRPQPSAAGRIERRARGMSGRRIVDDAALVEVAAESDDASVEVAPRTAAPERAASASPRVIRSPSRVERDEQAVASRRSPVQAAAARAASVDRTTTAGQAVSAAPASGRSAVASSANPAGAAVGPSGASVGASDGAASATKAVGSANKAPTEATRAFARSARALATSGHTPERVSSVLHAAARAALGGDHDKVERLLRVADTAVRREEAAQSLMPKVVPRHGSRKPSMWSALRSPVDSAVSLAAAEVQEDDAAEVDAPRRERSASTVPVVRSSAGRPVSGASVQRSAGQSAGRKGASVKAAERSMRVPVSSDAARTVLRAAPPQVRARVKALLSRRSRPSPLGYARLADVEQVVQAVSEAVAQSTGQQATTQIVRDTAGRQRLAQSRKAAVARRSRPSTWAGSRTASAVTDPDPRVRRAVSAMSVFRTALGEMTLPASEVMDFAGPAGELAGSSGGPAAEPGARQGRHVLRTADGRFVSARAGASGREAGAARSGGAGQPSAAARRAEQPIRRRAATVDTDGGLLQAAADSGSPLVEEATERSARGQAGQPYRSRPGLQATLGDVDETSAARPQLPVWARRASGSPLVRSSEQRDVMKALAGASTPEQVVQVIAHHGAELTSVPSSLPAPVLKVIEQVREGARHDLEERFKSARAAADGDEAPTSRPRAATATAPSQQVVQMQRGLRRRKSARRQSGQGDDRVMKLAKKLESLIHIAQGTGDRDEARRQVRMAEDSSAARAEGQGGVGESGGGKSNAQADIESLVTEVVQSVNRELALRRERRQEDPDGGNWW